MNLTAADIRELCAAGNAVRIAADGAISVRPITLPTEAPRAMTPAEKQRAYRARTKSVTALVTQSGPEQEESVTAKVTNEPESVTSVTSVTALPSPPPLSPTPPIPAPTPAGGARERTREAEADFQAACSVDLDLTASPELRQAWTEWQTYRQRRHKSTGTAKLPWTEQAAKLSASQITRNAETHGTQIVTDRIASAIAGNWQGLNFDTLKTNGHAHNQQTSSRFPSTSPAAAKVRPPDGDGRPKDSEFDV